MQPQNVDPLLCPLCGQANACVNLAEKDVSRSCWCNDPAITFPAELLNRIPPDARRKACICKACVLAFNESRQSGSDRS